MAKTVSDSEIRSAAARLSDPLADKQTCENAGRKLLDAVRNQPFDRLKETLVSLSYGLRFFKGLGRRPPRPNDFVFTDHALAERAAICRAAGERMTRESDRSKTRAERDDVKELLDSNDMGQIAVLLDTDNLNDAELDEVLDLIASLSEPDAINRTEDDLMDAQDVKLDLMMYILAQAFVAAGDRLKELAEYRL